MRKAVVGFVAAGAILGLLPAARRVSHRMREHFGQMAAQCKQMAAQRGGRGEPVGGI